MAKMKLKGNQMFRGEEDVDIELFQILHVIIYFNLTASVVS